MGQRGDDRRVVTNSFPAHGPVNAVKTSVQPPAYFAYFEYFAV
jgi:hypothetical protein